MNNFDGKYKKGDFVLVEYKGRDIRGFLLEDVDTHRDRFCFNLKTMDGSFRILSSVFIDSMSLISRPVDDCL